MFFKVNYFDGMVNDTMVMVEPFVVFIANQEWLNKEKEGCLPSDSV